MKNILRFALIFLTVQLISTPSTIDESKQFQLQPSCKEISHQQRAAFSEDLEKVREILKIPGMSVAVVCDQELFFAEGFGYADLEKQTPATPETSYGLASVTKPISAVLIMQLVEVGVINLDAPVTQYGLQLEDERITVRHLLTHTSEGIPGMVHHYNGDRYALLAGVIENATGQSFARLLNNRILIPLGMSHSALNPITSWGSPTMNNTNEFELMFGVGDTFRNYPNAYSNLAKPYQLDEANEIVPGMYPLHHNPAAGMISSVADLALFDMALDRGELLGEKTRNEMLAPAYSTYNHRQDLKYGLGWYIQDFLGLEMQWHTGRWQPSTSALYLKIPDKELTLIVLSNTDNLTNAFPGIGAGDISKSLLTLTLFRHFIFPEIYGAALPSVDWQADPANLVNQLNTFKDPNIRNFLERELWSYRQAFASTGDIDKAEDLYRINLRAFSRSTYRNDWMFINTSAKPPIAPPLMSPATYLAMLRGATGWFGLVLVSFVWMMVDILPRQERSPWERGLWLIGTVFLGPIAIAIYRICCRGTPSEKGIKLRKALTSSLLMVSGYGIGWAIAMTVLTRISSNAGPLTILGVTYLIPLATGMLLCRLPLLSRPGRKIGRCLLSEIITFNISFSALFSVTLILNEQLINTLPTVTSPFFWLVMGLASFAAILTIVPFNTWMQGRGYTTPGSLASAAEIQQPSLREAWRPLLMSIVLAFAAITLSVLSIR